MDPTSMLKPEGERTLGAESKKALRGGKAKRRRDGGGDTKRNKSFLYFPAKKNTPEPGEEEGPYHAKRDVGRCNLPRGKELPILDLDVYIEKRTGKKLGKRTSRGRKCTPSLSSSNLEGGT